MFKKGNIILFPIENRARRPAQAAELAKAVDDFLNRPSEEASLISEEIKILMTFIAFMISVSCIISVIVLLALLFRWV